MRTDLAAALGEGRGVTAKIRWLTKADEDGEGEGRPRWIHCTPLVGHSGAVGVWMVVLVDEEGSSAAQSTAGRRFRPAPPVAPVIGGKDWDASQRETRLRERKQLNAYDKNNERRGGGHAGVGVPRTERDHQFPPSGRPIGGWTNSDLVNQADRAARANTPLTYRPYKPLRPESVESMKSGTGGSEISYRIKDIP